MRRHSEERLPDRPRPHLARGHCQEPPGTMMEEERVDLTEGAGMGRTGVTVPAVLAVPHKFGNCNGLEVQLLLLNKVRNYNDRPVFGNFGTVTDRTGGYLRNFTIPGNCFRFLLLQKLIENNENKC